MCKVVQKLRETVPPMNFDIRYIAEAAKEQPEELREKFAAAWATRWLIHLQDREKAAHDQQLVIAAEDMIETDLVEGFQSMIGLQSESSDLDRELSCLADPALRHNQLFTSLMKDVDRNMMILPPTLKLSHGWIRSRPLVSSMVLSWTCVMSRSSWPTWTLLRRSPLPEGTQCESTLSLLI